MNPPVECRVGADCASGVCTKEGKCMTVAGGGSAGGSSTGGGMTAGGSVGGGATAGGAGGGTSGGLGGGAAGGQPGCTRNFDGVITRAEVVTQAGLHATFRVSGQATFDTAGTSSPDGGRAWDFTQMLTGDQATLVETIPIQGKWFESSYPGASYVAPLGQGTDYLAIFKSDADGLYLMGTADPMDGVLATKLVYTPPVKLLAFPMRAGDTWTTMASVTGTANGAPIGGTTDTYTSSIDRVGDAITPYDRFPVLRVRTVMNRSVPLYPLLNTSFRQYQFVTECFGTVATIRSRDLESSTEFTQVKEVRRLTP